MSRKRCKTEGCRRLAKSNGLCDSCGEVVRSEAPSEVIRDPLDVAKRLSPVELLQLGKIGVELQNVQLQIRVLEHEAKELKRDAETKLLAKERERQLQLEMLKRARANYDSVTLQLSKKYGIEDPKNMVVDADTGVIHDATNI